MEQMLGKSMRPLINLKKFLADYKEILESEVIPEKLADTQKAMEIPVNDSNRFHAVMEKCSLNLLDQDDDVHITEFVPGFSQLQRKCIEHIPRDALQLKSYNVMRKSKQSATRNPFQRTRDIYKFVQVATPADGKIDDFYNDLIVSIRVYRPARATHIGRSLEKPVFAEEFECLGSNFLTEFRDQISCVCNKYRFFDVSEDPYAELPKKKSDPGYFFITDTFYKDTRLPNNVDYSQTIRDWAKNAKGIKDQYFKVAKMENTRFVDLTMSMGFPQLYHHHGNCEHIFTFSQVEVVSRASQRLASKQYPCLRSFGLYNNRLCNMCGSKHYVFIVEQSARQLHDPAYLCSKCFYSFHYIDGKKVGNFKAYRINEAKLDPSITETAAGLDESIIDNPTAENSCLQESFSDSVLKNEEIEFISIKKE